MQCCTEAPAWTQAAERTAELFAASMRTWSSLLRILARFAGTPANYRQYVQLLERRYQGKLDAESAQLPVDVGGVDRCAILLNDLLDTRE